MEKVNYYHLAEDYAKEAIEEAKRFSDWKDDRENIDSLRDYAFDHLHQSIDGCQEVIYTYKAWQLCAEMDTAEGEDYLRDNGMDSIGEQGIDGLISQLAYATLFNKANECMQEILEEIAEAAEEEEEEEEAEEAEE